MIWTVVEEQLTDANIRKHAGGKAREDLSCIIRDCGISEITIDAPQIEREKASSVKKILFHFKAAKEWNKVLKQIGANDVLLLQFPVVNHTLLFKNIMKRLVSRDVKIIAFIHDLEFLRMSNSDNYSRTTRWRMKREELDELGLFDTIIVHNEKMKEALSCRLGLSENKLKVLNIFDYLIKEEHTPSQELCDYNSCIIAGNLKSSKSGYVYKLPPSPEFELYGIEFEGSDSSNVHYHGSFLADELPFHLEGGFGLVWDGDSVDTCSGAWGEYLRVNNPHKTSLYLACGIPVVIWKEAALAEYIIEHDVGIVVQSLYEISDAINGITPERYSQMRNNAARISKELRRGSNTKRALFEAGVLVSNS